MTGHVPQEIFQHDKHVVAVPTVAHPNFVVSIGVEKHSGICVALSTVRLHDWPIVHKIMEEDRP